MPGPVRLERDELLAELVLAAPPLNLFDAAMLDGIRAALDVLESEPPRGLLLRAEGRVVSGGVDVHEFEGLSIEQAEALFEGLIEITRRVEDLPLPTVFAAHGLCLTAAFELALGCDLLLAARSARFGLVERVVAITPAMGGTQRLAARAGAARARELVYTGDLYDAATMHEWGVANRILDDEGFAEASRAYALRVAEGPTRAHAVTKRIVRAESEGGVAAADALTPRAVGELFVTDDTRQAIASFLADGPGHATYAGR